MNSTDKLMKCIICQENIKSSINSLCVKGHIHCNECALSLDGACGLCAEPIGPFQESCEMMLLKEIDTKNVSPEENQAEAEFLVHIEASEQCVAMQLNLEIEHSLQSEDGESQDLNSFEPQIEKLTNDIVSSTGLYDTLKALHKTMCERKCQTFDSCIRKLLLKIVEESSLGTANLNIQSTQSLDDLLETLHINLCELDCADIERCLNAQFENVIKQEEAKYKEKALNKPPKVNIPNEDASNVVRSCYRAFKSKPAKAQFQYLTDQELPESYKSIMLNEFDQNLAFATETAQTQCPLINCKLQLNDFDALAHMQEQHRNFIIEPMHIGECKTFFIDPSILERNEVECLLCFVIPSTINVPIFVMVCRSALSKLYADDEFGYKKTLEESFRIFEEDAVIEAEIAEGTKKNFKNKPVKWSNEDVLIIWPIAPIPINKTLKTVLNVFLHNKKNCHRSVSFPMRTMQHSRKPLDVFGSPDAFWLTNVEIDELTNHGQHVIQCQIICKI